MMRQGIHLASATTRPQPAPCLFLCMTPPLTFLFLCFFEFRSRRKLASWAATLLLWAVPALPASVGLLGSGSLFLGRQPV